MRSVEVVCVDGKGLPILEAVARAARRRGSSVMMTDSVKGEADEVVVYGAGRAHQGVLVKGLVRRGRRAIVIDRGYWNRAKRGRRYRIAVDGAHPKRGHVLSAQTSGRPHPEPESPVYDPEGFALLCSSLPRSTTASSNKARDVLAQLRLLRGLYRDMVVRYRPKPGREVPLGDMPFAGGPIREAMTGAAVAIVGCSNVGVDAIIHGVPAVVSGGIASAFWACDLAPLPSLPGPEARRQFLGRVAWFNWAPEEADDMLDFAETLCAS